MTQAEIARRVDAVRRAVIGRSTSPFPPSLIAEPIPERVEVVDPRPKPPEAADGEDAVDGARSLSETEARQSVAADPRPIGPVCRETRAEPDVPVERMEAPHPEPTVTITISGLPHSGKSVVAHMIRTTLAYEGIPAEGPTQLRPIRWRGRDGALDNLIARGLRVVLIEEETA